MDGVLGKESNGRDLIELFLFFIAQVNFIFLYYHFVRIRSMPYVMYE